MYALKLRAAIGAFVIALLGLAFAGAAHAQPPGRSACLSWDLA